MGGMVSTAFPGDPCACHVLGVRRQWRPCKIQKVCVPTERNLRCGGFYAECCRSNSPLAARRCPAVSLLCDGDCGFCTEKGRILFSILEPNRHLYIEMNEADDADRYRILTVGDGDLSLSLALIRAFGSNICLTASTLLTSSELLTETYGDKARDNVCELFRLGITIKYGIDATKLHEVLLSEKVFDIVMFHHPHLGDYNERDVNVHMQRHHVLMAHYFFSAAQIARRIHVCLRETQFSAWQISPIAKMMQLNSRDPIPVSQPIRLVFHEDKHIWDTPLPPKDVSVPRRALWSRTSSRHWLIRYGYTPQKTDPRLVDEYADMSGSYHYCFDSTGAPLIDLDYETGRMHHLCPICRTEFDSREELASHLDAPATPKIGLVLEETSARLGTPAKSPSLDVRGTFDDNATVIHTAVVPPSGEGIRLRWYIQHFLTDQQRSKSVCKSLIAKGLVRLNGDRALDTGRILHESDVLEILEPNCSHQVVAHKEELRVIDCWNETFYVVWKPVGVRAAGTFHESTLESAFTMQIGKAHSSLSRLDTGISGLCVLRDQSFDMPELPPVFHTFTALVLGNVPEQWKTETPIKLPVGALRRWGRKDTHQPSEDDAWADALVVRTEFAPAAQFHMALCTVQVTTSSRMSGLGSVIPFFLRKEGCPVAGDRFAANEYMTLPRGIRFRMKNRVHICCTAVLCGDFKTQVDTPDRFSANFWEQFCNEGD